jgi:hypothetical protein
MQISRRGVDPGVEDEDAAGSYGPKPLDPREPRTRRRTTPALGVGGDPMPEGLGIGRVANIALCSADSHGTPSPTMARRARGVVLAGTRAPRRRFSVSFDAARKFRARRASRSIGGPCARTALLPSDPETRRRRAPMPRSPDVVRALTLRALDRVARIVRHDARRPQPVEDPAKPPRPLVVARLAHDLLPVADRAPKGCRPQCMATSTCHRRRSVSMHAA